LFYIGKGTGAVKRDYSQSDSSRAPAPAHRKQHLEVEPQPIIAKLQERTHAAYTDDETEIPMNKRINKPVVDNRTAQEIKAEMIALLGRIPLASSFDRVQLADRIDEHMKLYLAISNVPSTQKKDNK